MQKIDLVNKISVKTGIPTDTVTTVVNQLHTEIKNALISGEPVYTRGFGSFILKHRAAKKGRNIKRGEMVAIPAHYIPAFKPATEFKQAIKDAGTAANATDQF